MHFLKAHSLRLRGFSLNQKNMAHLKQILHRIFPTYFLQTLFKVFHQPSLDALVSLKYCQMKYFNLQFLF